MAKAKKRPFNVSAFLSKMRQDPTDVSQGDAVECQKGESAAGVGVYERSDRPRQHQFGEWVATCAG